MRLQSGETVETLLHQVSHRKGVCRVIGACWGSIRRANGQRKQTGADVSANLHKPYFRDGGTRREVNLDRRHGIAERATSHEPCDDPDIIEPRRRAGPATCRFPQGCWPPLPQHLGRPVRTRHHCGQSLRPETTKPAEGRLFCNLARSYIGYLLAEHGRSTSRAHDPIRRRYT